MSLLSGGTGISSEESLSPEEEPEDPDEEVLEAEPRLGEKEEGEGVMAIA